MDERALTELLECSVCLEQLDATSKVLQCQHTFCRRCLEEIVATKHELRCPECRALVEMRVDELPSNILLIRLLEGLKNCKAGLSGPTSANSSPIHTAPPSPASATGGARTSPVHKTVNTSQPCARALYNYEAKEPGDLTFKKGDVILLRRQVDENWYHGELNNQHGFFPATYVQVITPLPQEIPKCKALYDFVINDKNEKDCLTFQKDEILTVIRRVDDNWAEGKLGERIGIFPISFVEMNDSAKWLINNQTQINARPAAMPTPAAGPSTGTVTTVTTTTNNNTSSSTDSSPPGVPPAILLHNPNLVAVQRVAGAGQKRHSLTCITSHKVAPQVSQHHRHSMELSGTLSFSTPLVTSPALTVVTTAAPVQVTTAGSVTKAVTLTSQVTSTTNPPEGSTSTSSSSTAASGLILYVALYNYKPQKEDEVELRKGDYYTVSEKCQDGWFKGTCLRSGSFGVFPGNYVQLVKISSKQTSSSVNRGAAPGAVSVSPAGGTTTVMVNGQPRQPPFPKMQHITVSRAHSFPKTSPLAASLDYQVKAGAQAVTRAPNVSMTPQHTRTTPSTQCQTPTRSPSSQVGTPTRTITGPTRTHGTPVGSTQTSPAHAARAACSNGIINSPSSNGESRKAHHSHGSHSHSRTAGCSTNSPRSSRKSERSKHSSSAERTGKHCGGGQSCGHRSHGSGGGGDVPPHTPTRTPHSGGAAASSTPSHSARLTPPNVIVGAVGGDPPPPPPAPREKEKEKKKEKDRLGLMKRLTKSKKSKSPPPDTSSNSAASTSEPASTHQRTGSCPANSVEGATAGATPTHRKTSSLDSASSSTSKQPRTKPLLRERCRCIVPYPPQSDIELELKVGDIVYVHKKREDGWYKGTLQRTGKTGLFPGSFVDSF